MKLTFALLGAAMAVVDRASSSSTSTSTSASSSATSSTTAADTLSVWTTATTNGVSTAYQVAFSQSFSQLWSTVATPSSGTIGLGSIEGTVGTYRSVGAAVAASTNSSSTTS